MRITILSVVLSCLFLCAVPSLQAHAVGNVTDAHTLRTWTNTVAKITYKATFLLVNKDEVFLEDAAGKVIAVPFEQLSVIDRAVVDEHRERIRTINQSPDYTRFRYIPSQTIVQTEAFTESLPRNSVLVLAAVVTLTLGGMSWFGIVYLRIYRRPSLKASIFAASTMLLCIIALIESNVVPKELIAQTLHLYSKGISYPTKASEMRSVKFSNSVVVSSLLSSGGQSLALSAIDSIKILNTISDPALMNLAFAPYKATATTSWDDNYFYVASNGIPAHNMMIGITAWIAQVPIPHPYTGTNSWSIPLKPEYAASPLSVRANFMKGAIAVATNGIPIFNALNASGLDSKAIGELDQWNGHCGRADDYHYHAAPLQLEATSGLQPIAFALDGYAVYGSKEPDGTPMTALDQYHGHVGGNGVYHYHGTTTSPYVIEAMRGKVTLDPKSTAPENQIIPQAMTTPLRMTPFPINGATITNLTANAAGNGYTLEYTISGKKGSVVYSWTGNGITGLYTFTFTDTDGKVTVQTFQR